MNNDQRPTDTKIRADGWYLRGLFGGFVLGVLATVLVQTWIRLWV